MEKECEVCLEEKKKSEFFKLPCQHHFCKQCTVSYILHFKKTIRGKDIIDVPFQCLMCRSAFSDEKAEDLLWRYHFDLLKKKPCWRFIYVRERVEGVVKDVVEVGKRKFHETVHCVGCPSCGHRVEISQAREMHVLCGSCDYEFCVNCKYGHLGRYCTHVPVKKSDVAKVATLFIAVSAILYFLFNTLKDTIIGDFFSSVASGIAYYSKYTFSHIIAPPICEILYFLLPNTILSIIFSALYFIYDWVVLFALGWIFYIITQTILFILNFIGFGSTLVVKTCYYSLLYITYAIFYTIYSLFYYVFHIAYKTLTTCLSILHII